MGFPWNYSIDLNLFQIVFFAGVSIKEDTNIFGDMVG